MQELSGELVKKKNPENMDFWALLSNILLPEIGHKDLCFHPYSDGTWPRVHNEQHQHKGTQDPEEKK
jgi:hypothetical protein